MSYSSVAFLYPSDPVHIRQVDESYRDEFSAVQQAGLAVHCLDIENICDATVYPALLNDTVRIVYRGWMLTEQKYAQLEQRFGSQMLTSVERYCMAHYFPRWYPLIRSLTIPSRITDQKHMAQHMCDFADGVFIKDYVKSLKTRRGSIAKTAQEADEILNAITQYRGVIEGGIVLREVVDLLPDSETRFFVVHNTIFNPGTDNKKFRVVEQVVDALAPQTLHFYSVDVALKRDGTPLVIEIGDGQVSDHVGWTLTDFVLVLSYLSG